MHHCSVYDVLYMYHETITTSLVYSFIVYGKGSLCMYLNYAMLYNHKNALMKTGPCPQ